MVKSPVKRVGGKFYLAPKIIALFPAHNQYAEVFGGAMHVLFRKEPSLIEVYNDLDSGIYTFFKVVKEQPEALIKSLEFSLYSRREFDEALKVLHDEQAPAIERAGAFFIVNRQSFGAGMRTWGYQRRNDHKDSLYAPRTYQNSMALIHKAHERLQHVLIECKDFRDIINRYDHPDTLFYLDPPYTFNENRSKRIAYKHEMADGDHVELVEILKGIKGKFLLSGYGNELYDYFDRVSLGEVNITVTKTLYKRTKKEEFLWKNF